MSTNKTEEFISYGRPTTNSKGNPLYPRPKYNLGYLLIQNLGFLLNWIGLVNSKSIGP